MSEGEHREDACIITRQTKTCSPKLQTSSQPPSATSPSPSENQTKLPPFLKTRTYLYVTPSKEGGKHGAVAGREHPPQASLCPSIHAQPALLPTLHPSIHPSQPASPPPTHPNSRFGLGIPTAPYHGS